MRRSEERSQKCQSDQTYSAHTNRNYLKNVDRTNRTSTIGFYAHTRPKNDSMTNKMEQKNIPYLLKEIAVSTMGNIKIDVNDIRCWCNTIHARHRHEDNAQEQKKESYCWPGNRSGQPKAAQEMRHSPTVPCTRSQL